MPEEHVMDLDTAVLTVTEAAKVLRLSRSYTYELVAQGGLPSMRLGRRVLVPRAALELFIETRAVADESHSAPA
jgi:excisionase family DNA binding protein